MCRLRGTRVLHGRNSRRMWYGRGRLYLRRRLRYDRSTLLHGNDRPADLTLGRAFFG